MTSGIKAVQIEFNTVVYYKNYTNKHNGILVITAEQRNWRCLRGKIVKLC